jgi:hypothetical protein
MGRDEKLEAAAPGGEEDAGAEGKRSEGCFWPRSRHPDNEPVWKKNLAPQVRTTPDLGHRRCARKSAAGRLTESARHEAARRFGRLLSAPLWRCKPTRSLAPGGASASLARGGHTFDD